MIFIYTVFGFKLSLLGSTDNEQSTSLLGAIRIDDLIIVLFIFMYLLKGKSSGLFFRKKPVVFFMLYIVVSLISSVYNAAFGEVELVSSLLFTLRPVEYFVYMLLGYELAKLSFSPDLTLKVYVIYCLVLIAGQTLGLIGGFSKFSFDRAIANTGGPWELAAVSAFLMTYFLLKKNTKIGSISGIILLLTQSRITLVASAVTFLFGNLRLIFDIVKKKTVILAICCLLTLQLSITAYSLIVSDSAKYNDSSGGVTARFEAFGNNESRSTMSDIFANTEAAANRKDYFNRTYGEGLNNIITNAGSGDASAFIRFTRWVTLIKTASKDVISFLIGLGPSYAGMAVDGNYVRLFVETGLLGLVTYIMFLISCLRNIKEKLLTNYVCILAITALFIDIFVTFKAMFFFWFFYGYYVFRKEISKEEM